MIIKKNENDMTHVMCVPGAIAIVRRRCPMTRQYVPGEFAQRAQNGFIKNGFINDGYLEAGSAVVVCSIHPKIENLIEIMTAKGSTRFVMTKFLRFNHEAKESK